MATSVGPADRGDLRVRTTEFALCIVSLYRRLPKTADAQVLGKQVLRSGTSVGAHYREASRARSSAEYVSKMAVGLQELDETPYWLELLASARIVPADHIAPVATEADELTRMFVACLRTAQQGDGESRV